VNDSRLAHASQFEYVLNTSQEFPWPELTAHNPSTPC
jgi:hypothetical protein